MRSKATLFACLAVVACLAAIAAGCGGSASETPFPLEPDRATLARPGASGERSARADDDGETDDADEGFDGAEQQPLPAPPTWGAAPKRRR